MTNDSSGITDGVASAMQMGRMPADRGGIKGRVIAELRGPDGALKGYCEVDNLVTAVGDQYYAGRAALASGLPAQVTGFRLGTGSTAVAKTGAGAAIVTYLTGSNKANDGSFPTAVAGVVTWKRTYAAGEATTASPITEVVLNTDTIANDNATTATAANTISRALLAGIGSKAAGDTLTVTWTHSVLGA
jgi:hypothetical protein